MIVGRIVCSSSTWLYGNFDTKFPVKYTNATKTIKTSQDIPIYGSNLCCNMPIIGLYTLNKKSGIIMKFQVITSRLSIIKHTIDTIKIIKTMASPCFIGGTFFKLNADFFFMAILNTIKLHQN